VRRWITLLLLLAVSARGFDVSPADASFLDKVEHGLFLYFDEQADPVTGLVADRARADGTNRPELSSIAATGFGLTALCVGAQRGWIPYAVAEARVRKTLEFLRDGMPHVHGFYYHFIYIKTGERAGRSEVSSIDTALLLAGVLTVRQYFPTPEIERAARAIYERVDWEWIRDGKETLSMGWTPERGFLPAHWVQYNECLMLYLMALGSPTKPIPAECWTAFKRSQVVCYAGQTFIQCAPLFTHQYSQAWFDFRGQRDDVADYFRNSTYATLAQRQFCCDQRATFPRWSENLWGLTAADTVKGYCVFGTEDVKDLARLDGTLVPCAPGGSLPFAPVECLAALKEMDRQYGRQIFKRYGFVDAFNPQTGWVGADVIGIDAGIMLVMAENLRSELTWKHFMKNPEIQAAMKKAKFRVLTTDEKLHLDEKRTSIFLQN
jgi:hypothetical protein